ncbi:hypothetical protein L3X38_016172 [Prunus dulcis]|uniref:Uncharacterized protein n=1 Tax=Prunus dulcis TaxID=3755 RepID=A0AAD4W4X0_PRUDU|nr:hypothetical protein L3X38_016172 [Prunus dulcis]
MHSNLLQSWCMTENLFYRLKFWLVLGNKVSTIKELSRRFQLRITRMQDILDKLFLEHCKTKHFGKALETVVKPGNKRDAEDGGGKAEENITSRDVQFSFSGSC